MDQNYLITIGQDESFRFHCIWQFVYTWSLGNYSWVGKKLAYSNEIIYMKWFELCLVKSLFLMYANNKELIRLCICTVWSAPLLLARTQYKWTGHWHTGKCIYWKYVVKAELSKLRNVEVLAYLWFFFKKQWLNILSLRLYCYIYWKFIPLYVHQQETKVTFLAIFGTFSRKSPEINLKRLYCSESSLLAVVLWNSTKMKPRQHIFVFLSVTSPFILGPRLLAIQKLQKLNVLRQ